MARRSLIKSTTQKADPIYFQKLRNTKNKVSKSLFDETKTTYQKHAEKKHSDRVQIRCEIPSCSQQFPTPDAYFAHFKDQHPFNKLDCMVDECGDQSAGYYQKEQFIEHMKQ